MMPDKEIDRVANGLIQQLKEPDPFIEKGIALGLPVLCRVKELSNNFEELNEINSENIMEVVLNIDEAPDQVLAVLASPNNPMSNAMQIVYRYRCQKIVDPRPLFDASVESLRQNTFLTRLLELGLPFIEPTVVEKLLQDSLRARPGDYDEQLIACNWVRHYPSSALIEPLESCLGDASFRPITSAVCALFQIDPLIARRWLAIFLEKGSGDKTTDQVLSFIESQLAKK